MATESTGPPKLANDLRKLGIDLFSVPRDQVFRLIPQIWEGRRIDEIPESAIPFLADNFNVTRVLDSEGRALVHFANSEEELMKLHTQIAEISGQPRKVVKVVIEGLITQIRKSLKEDRGIRIPEVGKLAVRFRPAKEKRRGRNPFSGKEMWFKAKPASNKLRFSPAKDLKFRIRPIFITREKCRWNIGRPCSPSMAMDVTCYSMK